MSDIEELVLEKLESIEEKYEVQVISARDFGSTSWNLDSEDSDRDVSFVFVQKPLCYIQSGTYQETIDLDPKLNGKEHTFMGWNIKRFVQLLKKSNPTAIEFLKSSVTYKEKEAVSETLDELERKASENFKPIALFYHYRSMAKSNYERYVKEGDDDTLKRNLYVLRGLLYARYVEQTHQFPEIDFFSFVKKERYRKVLKEADVPEDLLETVEDYAKLKKEGEGDKSVGNPHKDWIEEELENRLDREKHDTRGINQETVNNAVEKIFGELECG